MSADELISGLPGESLIRQGLADCEAQRLTLAACLIGIARPRLTRYGLVERAAIAWLRDPDYQLYDLLCREGADAYSRYNSLLRELVSFEHALDHRCSRAARQATLSKAN